MNITKELLLDISPHGNKDVMASLVDPLNKYIPVYGIDTALRLKHFLGQAAEESDGFRTLREYASGREYENRRDLGNVVPGYGVKYKGRGIFQLTGFYNYKAEGLTLGIDLVNHPELAETSEVATQTACLYWKDHGLSVLADRDDITTITKRINGGLNGFASRQAYTARADLAIRKWNPLGNPPKPVLPVISGTPIPNVIIKLPEVANTTINANNFIPLPASSWYQTMLNFFTK